MNAGGFLPEIVLRRELECLRWTACGGAGGLDDKRFLVQFDHVRAEVWVRAVEDQVAEKFPAEGLDISTMIQRYLEPFVHSLPSVVASEFARARARRAAADAEYDSWWIK